MAEASSPCARCGNPVVGRRGDAKYCSKKCSRHATRSPAEHSRRETERVAKARREGRGQPRCLGCDEPFEAARSDRIYCSMRCNQRDHRRKNRERYREVGRAWIAANPATVAESYRRYRAKTATDPVRLERLRLARRRSEAKRRAAMAGAFAIAFTPTQLAARVAFFGGTCWMCKEAQWEQLDHVKPLSRGGPHILANLRPACRSCNARKKDRWPLAAT